MLRSVRKITLSCFLLHLGICSAATLPAYGPPDAGQVRILRDRYGVPHIIAADNRSLFYGAGYCQAEDQLENIAKNYLRASGRSAEFEGSSALAMDHLVRLLRIPERGDEHYAELQADLKAQLDGFAAGINAYLRAHRQETPDWIVEVKPQDVLRFSTYVDVLFTVSDCRGDLERAGIKLAATPGLLDRHDLVYGSNQFAVSPRRSGTGTAQLSMDPHLPHTGFYRWYEMHLVGPEINVMGACFFGSPYVSMGRSETTAWCMTVNGPDLGDVFAFDVKSDDPTQYRDVDGWKTFEDSEETYRVLEKNQLVEKKMPCRRTPLGPVMAIRDGRAYVFALPWATSSNRVRQFYDMARARTVDEFKDALRQLGLVMFNILYADMQGDILYISNARIPRRDQRIASLEIRPGHEEWARWQGYHALDELPQVLNPPAGFLMNTNSGPQNVCPDVAPRGEDFPPYVMGQEANSRSRRLNSLLVADEEIDAVEMLRYATDTHVEAADEWLPKLLTTLDAARKASGTADADREQLGQVVDVLSKWNGRTDLDSRGAALFSYIFASPRFPDVLIEPQRDEVIQLVLKQSRQCQTRFGALDVPWQEYSRIRRGDLDVGIAGNGSREARLQSFTALRPSYGLPRDGRRYCSGGSSYGMVVDFSCGVRAVSCLPFGVSDVPTSKHFADQLPLYVQARFKPAWFDAEEVKANAESDWVLEAK